MKSNKNNFLKEYNHLKKISTAYCKSILLFTAVNNKIFDLLDKPKTAREVAALKGMEYDRTERFLNSLVGIKLLTKIDSLFKNTNLSSTYMVSKKDDYIGNMVLHDQHMMNYWLQLWQALKDRSSMDLLYKPTNTYDERTRLFIYAMKERALRLANNIIPDNIDLSGYKDMLDIGCGPGIIAVYILKRFPNLTATLFDLPHIIEITKSILKKKDKERLIFASGNIFKYRFIKESFDVIVLANILHIYNTNDIKRILIKSFNIVRPKGIILIYDLLLNNTNTGPIEGLFFDINMMVGTESGYVFSKGEIKAILKDIGFKQISIKILSFPYYIISAVK